MKQYIAITAITLALLLSASSPWAPRTSAMASPHHSTVSFASRHHTASVSARYLVFGLGGSGVRGSVSVTSGRAAVFVSLRLYGLVPMSTHAVHVHAGSCAIPYAGLHQYILGYVRANASGAASLSALLPGPSIPAGRYLIVYAGPAPTTIIGCATL